MDDYTTIKVTKKTRDEVSRVAKRMGLKVQTFADMCMMRGCAEYNESGVNICPPSIANDSEARARLVESSAAMALMGEEKYGEWLSMLTVDEQDALKHCIKSHKEIAEQALNKNKIENSVKNKVDSF